LLEFSGERVVPGLVDPNLFHEHLARYRFAARFLETTTARVLDAGCGSGYGAAQFGAGASVVGIDVALEAVIHARENFGRSDVSFVQASCEAIPFEDGSFDLVVAFEVIEHLERWQDLLREAKRVLKPAGVLLVSTPNKTYYAKSRAAAGPNPYHVHEFEYAEFAAALGEVFPYAQLWSQNHTEAIAFTPTVPADGFLDSPADEDPASANFYFAACSCSPIANTEAFAWMPSAGNVLRERERHIQLLEAEVRQKTGWLEEQTEQHADLKAAHDALIAELERSNEWASQLNAEIAKGRQVIADLQKEAVVRLDWVHSLEKQIAGGNVQIERQEAELIELHRAFEERTRWGEEKADEVLRAAEQKRALDATQWMRVGRKLGFVPDSQ
jgi:SAM-dependent methyltransferase